MRNKQILLTFFLCIFGIHASFAHKKELVLTIDDLPFVGESQNFHLDMIITALKSTDTPATGFVIAKEVTPKNMPMLEKFRDAGLNIGNHTLSHANLNKLSAQASFYEIDAADRILAPVLTEPKYFRYPYLAMGTGTKKSAIIQHLAEKKYQIAPISIDSKDFVFNQILLSVPQNERRAFLPSLKNCYLDFIWQQTLKAEEHSRYTKNPDQTQILLIHANLLNAYVLPDIINLYKQNGFNFVSLAEALKTTNDIEKPVLAEQVPKHTPTAVEAFFAWN